jgi:peptide alpha-N-acetyltransferase
LAARAIDPDHPKCHEQSSRLKHALDTLPEPLPQQIQDVLQSTFLSTLNSKPLKESNEEYLQSHSKSASHVHSVVRVRQALSPDDANIKSKSVENIQSTLSLPKLSLREVQEGQELLSELGATQDAKDAYLSGARKRWPDATVLKA